MTDPRADQASVERVEELLDALPGVEAADLSGYPDAIVLRWSPGDARKALEEAAHEIVEQLGMATPSLQVDIVGGLHSVAPERVRFDSLHVAYPEAGRMVATVTLEWRGKSFAGEAVGETGPGGEMRVSATAATRALEAAISGSASFRLIGVKDLHVFDHDLIAVLLRSQELPDHRLLGTAMIGKDRNQATVLAVLSATNRALGHLLRDQLAPG